MKMSIKFWKFVLFFGIRKPINSHFFTISNISTVANDTNLCELKNEKKTRINGINLKRFTLENFIKHKPFISE